ncbi:Uncharacterised protein [Vibrio cholerae]|uniref:Uncharacterized protein n=1 Tax=Vibrio cholerae TaxID=666 RepID=A0A655S3Z4_VIBCL|nr:Uncharacterised protein [Vibrio cholerae]
MEPNTGDICSFHGECWRCFSSCSIAMGSLSTAVMCAELFSASRSVERPVSQPMSRMCCMFCIDIKEMAFKLSCSLPGPQCCKEAKTVMKSCI